MSTIGEFLREIIPSWLNRSSGNPHGAPRHVRRAGARIDSEDPRALAREADAVWQNCVDHGLHGEAYPEPFASKQARLTGRQGPAKSIRAH